MDKAKNSFQIDNTFLVLLAIYLALLMTAWATASKIIALPFGLSASVSTITAYAFCFVITDIISELYGYKASRITVRLGFMASIIGLCIFQLAAYLPAAPEMASQQAFADTLGYPVRIIIGGLIAFYISQHIDIFIFNYFKKKTNGKHLWLRNNASTACGQLADSVIWITIAFVGVIPNLFPLIGGEYLVKLCVAILDTIIIYTVLHFLRKKGIYPKTEQAL